MFAASLPAGKSAEPVKVRARSVVRVDAATGRLIRVIDYPRSGPAAKAPSGNLRALARATARSYGVDPLLVESVIEAESGYQTGAVSSKGAQGLMQLMPATARRFGVDNAFDPQENIEGGVKYLKYLQNLFQDDRLAIAAYNAGEGAVAKYSGVPPYKETVAYVEKVASKYGKARQEALPSSAAGVVSPSSGDAEPTRRVIAYTDSQGLLHMTTQ